LNTQTIQELFALVCALIFLTPGIQLTFMHMRKRSYPLLILDETSFGWAEKIDFCRSRFAADTDVKGLGKRSF
jgi:hypothetical protein